MRIRLTVGGAGATARLDDNATARDFASVLPVTITVHDLGGRDAAVTFVDVEDRALHAADTQLRDAGHRILAVHGDVADETQVAAAVGATVEPFGSLDMAYNNAAPPPASSSVSHCQSTAATPPAEPHPRTDADSTSDTATSPIRACVTDISTGRSAPCVV